ncbi:PREDICTED: protein RKD5 [Tarenaya hassleriana]|uniref:protein RKD5 n=1 Tax=Tarenaya hassleriana TaxID=28532 RepID=UPI00053C84DE|nr:PREDICTED: protein RKD5 [Tarenaya hassleriana]
MDRNPKLRAIPTLANELWMVSKRATRPKRKETSHIPTKEHHGAGRNSSDEPKLRKNVLKQDLNCLPDPETTSGEESRSDQTEQQESDIMKTDKKKRAPSKHVARLSIEELAKYFDLPISEASTKLNVGVTVLKRKCREFGIPRWPHRKIKSLISLILDLQGEAERQREKDETAAMAVKRRKKMLEIEKKEIEEKPFMEIQAETKRFRQDIFKRRHRATRLLRSEDSESVRGSGTFMRMRL